MNEELLNAIEEKKAELKAVRDELEKLKNYQKYEGMANEMYAAMAALINSGFTREEAFALLTAAAQKGV